MVGFITWICLLLCAGVVCAAVMLTVRKPMSDLLRVNSYISPARRFYLRTFSLLIVLSVLSVLISAGGPCAEQSKNFMECVWWVADQVSSVIWAAILSVGGYALLLTILFAVLGRYRDE